MRQTIELLKRKQEIETRVTEVARMRDSLNDDIKKMHRVLALGAAELEDKSSKLADAERFLKEQAAERQRDSEDIKRMQARLGSLTKNKEFNAAVREIDNKKNSVKEKEEQIGKLKEEIARYREGIESAESILDENRREVSDEEGKRRGELERLTAEIEEVGAERHAVEADLPKAVVRKYRRIAKAREGLAVVPVRDGQCTGCNRQVPPQLRIILLRANTLETCPICSRYMYVPDEELARYATDPNGASSA